MADNTECLDCGVQYKHAARCIAVETGCITHCNCHARTMVHVADLRRQIAAMTEWAEKAEADHKLAAYCKAANAAMAEVERINEIVDKLYMALDNLVDVQNGPPLESYTERWERAMAKANAALEAAEAAEEGKR